jgi:hypothetical protein
MRRGAAGAGSLSKRAGSIAKGGRPAERQDGLRRLRSGPRPSVKISWKIPQCVINPSHPRQAVLELLHLR